MDPIARHTFYKDNMHCIKAELKKNLSSTIRLTVVDEETQGWVGTGDFLDEHEVRDKYPKNQSRAEMIITNAKQFKCPDSVNRNLLLCVCQSFTLLSSLLVNIRSPSLENCTDRTPEV